MKLAHECIHCLARQAVEIAQEASKDKEDQKEIIKRSLKSLSALSFNETSPEIAYEMHQHAKAITGVEDPYKALKEEYNSIAHTIEQQIIEEEWLKKTDDSFDLACRLSIAGNIIDFSVGIDLDYHAVFKSVEDSLKKPVFGSGSFALKEATNKARNIMFIADNAGEIIFDKFLIKELPQEKVTYVVKGSPIVNDATMLDVHQAGIHELVKVIDNGYGAQGTLLHKCSEEFKQAFNEADLIISKGQANYETLSDVSNKNIFFLLRAKCQSVANSVGCQRMDYVLNSI